MAESTHVWLNRIETNWALVDRAHSFTDSLASSARHRLLDRYYGAACRYLLAATRSEDVADELLQEFALRFIRGDFRRVHPEHGRFRDYIKGVLINLVLDFRRQRARHRSAPADVEVYDSLEEQVDADEMFLASWRDELLHRTWIALEETHATLYAVLLIHVQNQDATAGEKASSLSRQLGQPFSANYFRVALHRARDKFSAILRHEVCMSLHDPSPELLRAELRHLRLLKYCEG